MVGPLDVREARPAIRVLRWLRWNFFRRWYDGVMTIAFAAGIAFLASRLYGWAIATAAFAPTPEACRAAEGACWSVIADMWPVFLAGLYPQEERWRVAAALAVLVLAGALTAVPALRRRGLLIGLWAAAPLLFMGLIRGGAFGLPVVEPQKWGGLLLTVILAVVSQSIAFPVGVALALARRAEGAPLLRMAATIYIEIVRSVPLVMVLLMTTLILPLFLPPSMPLNTVVTAAIGITLFSAAAIAEVVRGGLLGLPPGQEEAAAALGLRYWQRMRLVVLPQALRLVQPALVGTFITFVKGSSLVVAIGLYDLLGAAVLASTNPVWIGHAIEPLVFVAFVFWLICFGLSQYSRRLERRFSPNRRPRAPGPIETATRQM